MRMRQPQDAAADYRDVRSSDHAFQHNHIAGCGG
jgi:hypothetical protein